MRSQRRAKLLFYAIVISVLCILFYEGSLRRQLTGHGDEFWSRTVSALERRPAGSAHDIPGAARPAPGADAGATVRQVASARADTADTAGAAGAADEPFEKDVGVQDRLEAAAKQAKQLANKKAPKPDAPSKVLGVGSAAEGNAPPRRDGEGNVAGEHGSAQHVAAQESPPVMEAATAEERAVEVELNSILKKSPVIIFSKTWCPHSKRAKNILLGAYRLEPAPFVVELDQHSMGAQLQARLATLTKRSTVPNVLVNGVSIGGGDEVADLHDHGTLLAKVRDLAGAKIVTAMKLTAGE